MNDDHLVDLLVALCKRFADDPLAGRYAVAKRAGLSEQYLYQILTGKPMANGNQRSLGKIARAKINREFPDWLNGAQVEATSVHEPNARYELKAKVRSLVQTVCDLAEQIDDDGLRELVGFARCLTATHPLVKEKRA